MSFRRPTAALSLYAIKGLRFDCEPNTRIRRQLENAHPFLHANCGNKDVILHNILGCFELVKYYEHFSDVADWYEVIAKDLGWDWNLCNEILAWCRRGREDFLKDISSRYIPPGALDKETRLCTLVDDWRLGQPVKWIVTDDRRKYIAATRKRWETMTTTMPKRHCQPWTEST